MLDLFDDFAFPAVLSKGSTETNESFCDLPLLVPSVDEVLELLLTKLFPILLVGVRDLWRLSKIFCDLETETHRFGPLGCIKLSGLSEFL